MKLKIIYRISDNGYSKVKQSYINNENCLKNALQVFPESDNEWLIIADNCCFETQEMIRKYYNGALRNVSVGHGAGTFNIALDEALKLDDNYIVYFIENDYLHRPGSREVLIEGFQLGAPFVTLYLHPDKFISPECGGNPEVDSDGGYLTKIYKGETQLFAMFNSTTMTFASPVKVLREIEYILREYTKGIYPEDYRMFISLRENGKALLCPLNSFSTHGETNWLAPFINWSEI